MEQVGDLGRSSRTARAGAAEFLGVAPSYRQTTSEETSMKLDKQFDAVLQKSPDKGGWT
jgi:hypothetical protein